MKKYLPILLLCIPLAGCVAPQQASVPTDQKMTLGTVQQEIHKGMSQAEVVSALGSPNMVTRDREGTETWVYDKASTEVIASRSSAYGTVLLVGGSGSHSSAVTSQRTLTLIIKFKDAVVSEFSYRSTSF